MLESVDLGALAWLKRSRDHMFSARHSLYFVGHFRFEVLHDVARHEMLRRPCLLPINISEFRRSPPHSVECVTGKEKRLRCILHCSFALFVRHDETWPLVPQILRRYIRSWNCFSFLRHNETWRSFPLPGLHLSRDLWQRSKWDGQEPPAPWLAWSGERGRCMHGAAPGRAKIIVRLSWFPLRTGKINAVAHSRSRRGTYPGPLWNLVSRHKVRTPFRYS